MDKRRHRRLTTRIEVFFSIAQSGFHSGFLLDYGKGGALVVFKQSQTYSSLADPASLVSRVIQIHFPLDDKEFLLAGEVAHISERGIGVRFVNLDALAFAALAECARRATLTPANHVSAIVEQRQIDTDVCQQRLIGVSHSFLGPFLDEFVDYFSGRLLILAEERAEGVDPQACLDAVSTFAPLRRSLLAQVDSVYRAKIEDHFAKSEEGQSPQHPAPNPELSLVGKADFEEWLLVKVATSRAELALRQPLAEVLVRLETAVGRSLRADDNPLSPSWLFRICNGELRRHGVKDSVIRLFFKVLVDFVVKRFSGFYDEINHALIQVGVLPELSHGQSVLSKKVAPVLREHGVTDGIPVVSSQTLVADNPGQPLWKTVIAPASSFFPDEKVARDAFVTANRLLGMQRDLRGAKQPGEAQSLGAVTAESGAAKKGSLSVEGLFRALNRVCNELSTRSPAGGDNEDVQLPSHVMSRLKEMNVDCSDTFRDAIQMMGSLVANIADEQRMKGDLRSEFCKIQVPLAALQVSDPEIFLSEQHPVRELLNYLALLSEPESANFQTNAEAVKTVIQQLMAADPLDEKAISGILRDIKKPIDREKSIIERNVQRVIESCDGRQRIIQANEFLHHQLDLRVADRTVPRGVIQLLDSGWKELMRLSLLRDGPDSRSWQTSLQVIDDLVKYLGERPCPSEGVHFPLETLLKVVEKGLQKVVGANVDPAGLIAGLRSAAMAPAVEWTEGRRYAAKEKANDLTAVFPVRLCKKLQRLKVGQWLEYGVKTQKKMLCQIAWIGQRKDKYALVNQQGMRVVELSDSQFLSRLQEGDIQLLADGQINAVEKGLDALIQKIYEKLSFEASHDQLTGLLSRKEFEKSLAQSVARARRNHSRYALVYVDLMQFKLINSLCGYEGGDHLLQQIASALSQLSFTGQVCGRIGGNEFAVILPVETETDAYRYACQIKATIEGQRFIWGKNSHSLITAVSLCMFDQHTTHVLELLRTVEASTQMAKANGLKEVQVVKPGDNRFQERDSLMSWVARISHALENGLLRLRCQKIAPAKELHPEWLPHYEILLTVVDDDGIHIPPAEFIKAAETFGRMADVDRWVITQVLSWMKENERHLGAFGGFSINLSGHTLNDDSFLDFIFEQLVRFDVPRNKVIFEITETTAVSNLEEAADFIAEMKEIGCRFSLDDFGTGQSSYAYLKKLPVDFIKIDGAFIRKIDTDKVDYALVKSITEMGHYLNKHMVAEFVSDQAKYDTVVSLGVDYLQGFHLGKPIMLDTLIDEELRPITAKTLRTGGL